MKAEIRGICGMVVLCATMVFAAVPRQIAYQGVLTDVNGNPRPDGKYHFSFQLFFAETGGAALTGFGQADNQAESLTVKNGVFSTVLGKNGGITLPFDVQYWLGVTVNGTAMTQRVALGAAAYAMRSAVADSAVKAARSVKADTAGVVPGVASAGHTHSSLVVPNTSTQAVVVNGAGKVGVGTSNPTASVSICDNLAGEANGLALINNHWSAGSGSSVRFCQQWEDGAPSAFAKISSRFRLASLQDGADLHFSVKKATNLPADTGWIDAMTVRNTGWVGVGTIDPLALFHISGTNAGAIIDATNSNGVPRLYLRKIGGGSGLPVLMYADNGLEFRTGSDVMHMQISSAGNVGIGITNPRDKLDVAGAVYATSFSTDSDIRLKREIRNLPMCVSKITSLNGVTYEWDRLAHPERNYPSGRHIGLMAQEVESVLPELVHTDSEGYKSLSYDKLTAVLVEAIKELKGDMDEMKNQIHDLTRENQTLRREMEEIVHRYSIE